MNHRLTAMACRLVFASALILHAGCWHPRYLTPGDGGDASIDHASESGGGSGGAGIGGNGMDGGSLGGKTGTGGQAGTGDAGIDGNGMGGNGLGGNGMGGRIGTGGMGTGGAGPPVIAIAPMSHDYLTVPIGLTGTFPFQVSNSGGTTSGTPSISLSGTDAAQFSITMNGCTTGVAPSGSCMFTVVFTPTLIGGRTAAVGVVATPGNMASASLTGTAGKPIPKVIASGPASNHSCAVMTDGAIKCWGLNDAGQLGNGDAAHANARAPVDVTTIKTAVAIATGTGHSCAVLKSGAVNCWGGNSQGQLGNGDAANKDTTTPVAVTGITTAVAVTAGDAHTCAMLQTGAVKCWGTNDFGVLGNDDPTFTASNVPVDVAGDNGTCPSPPCPPLQATSIAAGAFHNCAQVSGGGGTGASCWGHNANGELGNSNPAVTDAIRPVSVTIGTISAIGGGNGHTCAVVPIGSVSCWGGNTSGQLGNGALASSFVPVATRAIATATALGIGGLHSCALLQTATVDCWGANGSGQLGNGDQTFANSSIPVGVRNITNAAAITAGFSHSCALLQTGAVVCWGVNAAGQLGNGDATGTKSAIPVTVLFP